ncbi:MAG: hypothetical protein ACKOQ3_13770 [Novosphingobium sp.]
MAAVETSFARLRTVADEVVSPKYSHLECERRWLVGSDTFSTLKATDPIDINDLYLEGSRLRLREMRSGHIVSRKLTKKYETQDACTRPIVTAYLDDNEFALFATLPGNRISKTRFRVVEGSHIFSVDVFGADLAGLVIAEIEASDLASLAAIPRPSWAVREITDSPAYQGGHLALFGIPENT